MSRKNRLEGHKRPFNLEHLMAFGTAATCYIPVIRRSGGKQPGQRRSFKGAIIGYEENMEAYRVWDFSDKKIRVVSYCFAVCHEGFYPFKDKTNWPPESVGGPSSFAPSIKSILDSGEWLAYGFTEEETDEVLSKIPIPASDEKFESETPPYTGGSEFNVSTFRGCRWYTRPPLPSPPGGGPPSVSAAPKIVKKMMRKSCIMKVRILQRRGRAIS